MHVRFGDRQQWHTSHDSKSSKQSPKNNKFLERKISSALPYTETKILNFINALNNYMLVFDHLNSSLSTIFDDLLKPFNEQHSHNTRGESRYVSNTLTNWKPWNGAILISKAIAIIYKFYNCNYSKNKNYKNPSTVGRINQDQVTWISCMFSRGLLKNSMFCVLPVFHEREMHLLNLVAFGFF